jgi:hypothetical protein
MRIIGTKHRKKLNDGANTQNDVAVPNINYAGNSGDSE